MLAVGGIAACGSNAHPAALAGSTAGHTATGSSTTSGAPGTPAASLSWGTCGGSPTGRGLQCATLQVPLNYAEPHGATIGIALDRLPATGSRIGSLLINPGGPGASGIDFLPDVAPQLSAQLKAHFDIVGFDPRGVGASDPVLCATGPQLDSYLAVDGAPPTAAGVASLIAADRTLVKGCQAESGALLPHVGTVDAARDLDRIRQAVGDAKLNYLGFSYGTFLGATYADEFPTHIRAMVLDGAENPALGAVATVDSQAAAVDAELGDFFDWCATGSNGCAWKPAGGRGAMEAAVLALVAQTRQHPLVVNGTTLSGGTSRSLGPTQVVYGTAEALYSPSSWPTLGQALQHASQRNGGELLSLFDTYVMRSSDGQYGNLIEANNAVGCEDQVWPSATQIESDAPAAEKAAPVFGLANLYSGLLCTVWPYPATDHPHPITAAGSPPIVVVGSTGDPATPYAWAQALASQLSKGVLVTRVGDGHTGYLVSSCVRAVVDTYLVGLRAPASGTRCSTDSS